MRNIPQLAGPYLDAFYKYGTPEFEAENAEVVELGGTYSATRTPYQTDTARFWLGECGYGGPRFGDLDIWRILIELNAGRCSSFVACGARWGGPPALPPNWFCTWGRTLHSAQAEVIWVPRAVPQPYVGSADPRLTLPLLLPRRRCCERLGRPGLGRRDGHGAEHLHWWVTHGSFKQSTARSWQHNTPMVCSCRVELLAYGTRTHGPHGVAIKLLMCTKMSPCQSTHYWSTDAPLTKCCGSLILARPPSSPSRSRRSAAARLPHARAAGPLLRPPGHRLLRLHRGSVVGHARALVTPSGDAAWGATATACWYRTAAARAEEVTALRPFARPHSLLSRYVKFKALRWRPITAIQ